MSNFPEGRQDQYSLCGTAIVLAARYLDAKIDDATAKAWVSTATQLADADDLSESVATLPDAHGLLQFLQLPTNDPDLWATADAMIETAAQERKADTLPAYFNIRTRQGFETVNLLRYQSPEPVRSNARLWQQLGTLCVVVTHLDGLMDCREDAKTHLTQFTAMELAKGSLVHTIRHARQLNTKTVRACFHALHELGADSQFVKRLIAKPLLSPDLYKRWLVGQE